MSSAALTTGLTAALHGLGGAAEARNEQARQTASIIRSIAVACEGFSHDTDFYPGPTEGWVTVESIAGFLEPVYIGDLPRIDAWSQPILYWSDGRSYRIVSLGADGRMDRDWNGVRQPTRTAAERTEADIVFADGRFLVAPEGVQE